MPKIMRMKDNEGKKDKIKEGMKENDNYMIIIKKKKKGKIKEDTKKHEKGEGKKKEYAEHKFGGHIDGKMKKPKKIIKK